MLRINCIAGLLYTEEWYRNRLLGESGQPSSSGDRHRLLSWPNMFPQSCDHPPRISALQTIGFPDQACL